jgi:hypothetical protein
VPLTRVKWERDKVQVTIPAHDGLTHFGYTTAVRTLCGAYKLLNNKRWAFSQNQLVLPQCTVCLTIMEKFVAEGLERHPLIPSPQCDGITGKGNRCERTPLPGKTFCPSHNPAARMYW